MKSRRKFTNEFKQSAGLVAGAFVFLESRRRERGVRRRDPRRSWQSNVLRRRDRGPRRRRTHPAHDLAEAVLNGADDLAFDILGVASPDPGPDLTVVVQT